MRASTRPARGVQPGRGGAVESAEAREGKIGYAAGKSDGALESAGGVVVGMAVVHVNWLADEHFGVVDARLVAVKIEDAGALGVLGRGQQGPQRLQRLDIERHVVEVLAPPITNGTAEERAGSATAMYLMLALPRVLLLRKMYFWLLS